MWSKSRFLIWGKTAPSLSLKYFETVCTGAVLENGRPIRLYPIPFRYLDETNQFKKYQWVTASIALDTYDTRPESYKINCDTIELGEEVPTDNLEWYARRQTVLADTAWQFTRMSDIEQAQRDTRRSLGLIEPQQILEVYLRPRPAEEEDRFEAKRERVTKQWEQDRQTFLFEDYFPQELKAHEFIKNRICVRWVCGDNKEHNMQVMDWELAELQRKHGDQKAIDGLSKYLDLSKFATRFFMGNIKDHPTSFTIVGLWRPKRSNSLF